ncbi:MAG TPA: cytochrome c [Phenylobacterium sp.]|jgi:mono/diheme cytochrome c family protein|nr:cytochrome c [Phenylobacterium sp.]
MNPLISMTGLLLAAATAASAAAPAGDPALARGAHLAQRDCAGCHAVTSGERSPNVSAPGFNELRVRFNPISLERRLEVFPRHGHEGMPQPVMTPGDIADLVAYIQSLEPSTRQP